MNDRRYVETTTFAKPRLSPEGTVSVLARTPDGDRIRTIRDDSSALSELSIDESSISEYGWADAETIWYVPASNDRIGYVASSGTTAERRDDRRRQETPISSDHEALFTVFPDDRAQRVAVVGRDRYLPSIELYTDGELSTPAAQFELESVPKPVGWDRQSERLVAQLVEDSFTQELVLFDAERGTKRTITEETTDARYSSVHWGPDDEQLYLVTDYDADHLYAATLSPDEPEPTPIVSEDDRSVESIGVHPSGRVLFAVNRDGESLVYRGELADDAVRDRERLAGFPSGVAKQASFSDSGNSIALTMSTETVPSALYVHDVGDDRPTKWAETGGPAGSAAAGTDGPDETNERLSETIRYEGAGGREIPALCSRPPSERRSGVAIVDVHGGPEVQRRPQYRGRHRWLLDQGHTVLEPNYRGSIGYGRTFARLDEREGRVDAVEDIARAGRWLRSETDCETVVVFGKSHGGLLALVNAYRHPEPWDGVISESGIYDLDRFIRSVEVGQKANRMAKYGNPAEQPELFDELSPLTNAESIAVPTLVIHGTADRAVPSDGAETLVDRIAENGVHAELQLFEGGDHALSTGEQVETTFDRISSFVQTVSE